VAPPPQYGTGMSHPQCGMAVPPPQYGVPAGYPAMGQPMLQPHPQMPGGLGVTQLGPAAAPVAGEEDEQPIASWEKALAAIRVVAHAGALTYLIWGGFKSDLGLSGLITLILSPLTVFMTVYNWCRGKYFPMTASDSFFLLRFGKRVDKNPPVIRAGAVLAMLVMGFFFSLCSFFVMSDVWGRYCPGAEEGDACMKEWHALSEMDQWKLRQQFWVGCVLAVLNVKVFFLSWCLILIWVFTFSLLGVLTCGYGYVVGIIWCFKGIRKESKFLGASCVGPYNMLAMFYRNM